MLPLRTVEMSKIDSRLRKLYLHVDSTLHMLYICVDLTNYLTVKLYSNNNNGYFYVQFLQRAHSLFIEKLCEHEVKKIN